MEKVIPGARDMTQRLNACYSTRGTDRVKIPVPTSGGSQRPLTPTPRELVSLSNLRKHKYTQIYKLGNKINILILHKIITLIIPTKQM